ncbi:MAG: ParB/RepB/Spo0J family partition protein [Planctomycetota bacterium]
MPKDASAKPAAQAQPATPAAATGGSKRKSGRLGRGLQSLMGSPPAAAAPAATPASTQSSLPQDEATASNKHLKTPAAGGSPSQGETGGMFHVELARIVPNRHQPRQQFDDAALEGLAASIREQGVLQPIVIRPDGKGDYELVAGERRLKAAKLAGLDALPAIVRTIDDQTSAELALIENVQREDLNPIDRAEAIQALVDEFGMTHAKVADRLGLNRATVTNLTRLLDLTPAVIELVREGLLSMGHARALAGITNVDTQRKLAERAVREELSVRQVEQLTKTFHVKPQAAAPPAGSSTKTRPAHITELESDIATKLGLRTKLKTGRKAGTGSLEVKFSSLDEFDALLAKLGVHGRSD